jgi:hypothetical protein
MERLVRYGIRFAAFYEPDFGMGLSAIATIPLNKKKRYALSIYPLWEPKVYAGSRPASQDAGVTVACANGENTDEFCDREAGHGPLGSPHQHSVSSVVERRQTSNGMAEVGGSSPSPGASFARLAQLVERQSASQGALQLEVGGSNPSPRTKFGEVAQLAR